jgi:2',3'-cyclic-nucleotide 2'-phosphodiesterase
MTILILGDIVGPPGVTLIEKALPGLRQRIGADVVIANAENACNGSGITPLLYRQLRAAGVDAITLGDHIYRKFDIAKVLAMPTEPVVKPANYPAAAPGKDHAIITVNHINIAIISLMGRTFMKPVDCPFAAADRVLSSLVNVPIIIVDIHAEATADKYLIAHYLDGRVSAVLGTHTHVATADAQILPKGTAFQCDLGMCGPHDSVLGRRIDRVLQTTTTFEPTAYTVATGDVRLNGAVVAVDVLTGQAQSIRRVQWSEADLA